jgi:Uma2 family endonuclease
MTEAEYLSFEATAQTRHEFRDGQVIDMAGGTFAHGRIAANLLRRLGERLEGSPCQAVGSDVRVRINKTRAYYYPDAMVVCGPPVYDPPETQTAVSNPRIVVEVSSPSSEADDRGAKFSEYRLIDSLEEYILISQNHLRAETFYRQSDGIWAIGPSATGLSQLIRFRSLDIQISLAEIYAGVDFTS